MKCPTCGLLNPDSAQRCDCGYDFASKSMQRSYLSDKQQQRSPVHASSALRLTVGHEIAALAVGAIGAMATARAIDSGVGLGLFFVFR